MRLSWEEPTGVRIRSHEGAEMQLSFPDFVQGIESGTIYPDDQARSRIVTRDQWVVVSQMRLYQVLTEQRDQVENSASQSPLHPWENVPTEGPGVWPPSPFPSDT